MRNPQEPKFTFVESVMMIQTLLGDSGQEICVIYHWHGPQAPAVIICAGMATSMSEPRYLFSILARQCHALGLNVFQFDYLGDGDSAGDYTLISQQSVLKSVDQVVTLAESLGCARVGLVGYGVGNIVASFLMGRTSIQTAVLISPHFAVFADDAQEIWNELAQLDQSEGVHPQVWHASQPISLLWKATVGETVVPAQPCGPLNPLFLEELRASRPAAAFLETDKPLLIISERKDDHLTRPQSTTVFESIHHDPTPYKPSWHWCAECREKVLTQTMNWFQTQLPVDAQNIPISVDHFPEPPGEPSSLPQDFQPRENARICPVTIELEGEKMLGILHIPSAHTDLSPICVIHEIGLPGQRVDVHRCGPRLAEAMAQQGFYVFRYDSRGMGVSSGEFYKFTWSRKLDDLAQVMAHLSALDPVHMGRFVILGNSAGGRIACMAANRHEQVLGSILWGPILVEPEERVGEGVVRRHPSGNLVTEYCGLWLGVKYNLDERRYDFLNEFEICRKFSLIILATDEENIVNKQCIQRIAAEHPEKDFIEMPGTHGFSTQSIADVIDTSVKWLKDRFNASG